MVETAEALRLGFLMQERPCGLVLLTNPIYAWAFQQLWRITDGKTASEGKGRL
jgi:hypothetical protein